MKKQWIAIIGGGVLAISLAVAGVGFADSEKSQIIQGTIQVTDQSEVEFPAMAKITLDQAIRGLMESTPGQILKAELEDEDGFLVYSFEVVNPDKTIMDVKLDAGSGKVLAIRKDKAEEHDHEKGDHEHNEHGDHEREE